MPQFLQVTLGVIGYLLIIFSPLLLTYYYFKVKDKLRRKRARIYYLKKLSGEYRDPRRIRSYYALRRD